MAEGNLFLVDPRDGFFEEGGARDGRRCPGCVSTGASVGKVGSGGGGGRSDVEDSWRSEG